MKVSLVGAGPGDPGLFTLAGRELLSKANVVVYDALADARLLAFANPEAELVYVGKVADQHALPQDEINALLVKKAREKGSVVRLKGGDPYIFGRGAEEGEYLKEHDIPFEEVPGISSAIAAPAYAGIPLTHRDLVSSLMIITGHEKPGKTESALNWKAFVETGSTLVFVMGMKNIETICANLCKAGMDPRTPAAVIYRGATPFQKVAVAPVSGLPQKAAEAGLGNPAVIVVGKVVKLREKLDWISAKPLLGKTIVVTRAREQASGLVTMLDSLGAQVIECPVIRIKPLSDYSACDAAIAQLDTYKWLIFTSVNGVNYFWQRLAHMGRDTRSLCSCKVAAIGPATAHALQTVGVKPDLVPSSYVAEAVAEELLNDAGSRIAGMKILIPRAAKARMVLPDILAKAGAIVDVVPVYETVAAGDRAEEVKELLGKGRLDCITFGSSSTVENLLAIIPAGDLASHPELLLAAIGPVTSATLDKHGLKSGVKPQDYTIPGLVKAITAYFSGKNK